jgi:DUF2075 family protein
MTNKKKDINKIMILKLKTQRLKWNSTNIDWVNSKNSRDEVGCIHTTQGYDLNYTGIMEMKLHMTGKTIKLKF